MTIPQDTAVASKYAVDDTGNPPEDQINSLGNADYPFDIIAADTLYAGQNITDGESTTSLQQLVNHNHDQSYSAITHTHSSAELPQLGTASLADTDAFATATHSHNAIDISGLGTAATAERTDFATAAHTHGEYANISHNHSGLYDEAGQADTVQSNLDMHTSTNATDAHEISSITGLGDALASCATLPTAATITQSITMDSTAFDKKFMVSGDAKTITLPAPAGNAGKTFTLIFNTNSGAYDTLASPDSTTVWLNGQGNSRVYLAGESVQVYCDGNHYHLTENLKNPQYYGTFSTASLEDGVGLWLDSNTVTNDGYTLSYPKIYAPTPGEYAADISITTNCTTATSIRLTMFAHSTSSSIQTLFSEYMSAAEGENGYQFQGMSGVIKCLTGGYFSIILRLTGGAGSVMNDPNNHINITRLTNIIRS